MIAGSLRLSSLVCAAALAVACHGSSNSPPVAQVTHVKKPAPVARVATPEELTNGMVEAVTLGKSTVPVNVKFDIPHKPVLGESADIVIAVMPQVEAAPAILSVSGSDTLVLAASDPIEIAAVEPTQVYRHNLKLTPTAEGVQLLNVSVALKHDEMTETRSFWVPLIVAAAVKP